MTDVNQADVFSDELYASGFWSKAKRAVQLGWRYYLWELPLYIAQRRSLGLSAFDIEAAVNPLRELFDRKRGVLAKVDGYEEALERLHSSGMRLTLPPSRIAALVNCWRRASGVAGDVIECGSYRGATGLLIALLGKLHSRDQTVLLLDTFQGSPAGSQYDALRRRSEYSLPEGYPEILRRQADALGVGDRIEICAGNFRDTFAVLEERAPQFCFAHIDANLYHSTREACRFVLPRIASGGCVVFDDYHGPCDLGARLAIDQCLAAFVERPVRLSGTSACLTL